MSSFRLCRTGPLRGLQYGISYAALRYANVYGPQQDPQGEAGVVAVFSRNLAAQKISTINGGGEQTRDYVYVGDVARANVLALEDDTPSGAYNIGTAVETNVNELYGLLQDLSGIDLPARHGPAKPGEQLRSCVDPARVGRAFGWRPEVQLAAGLKETLRYFEAYRQQFPKGSSLAHDAVRSVDSAEVRG